jgi:hypothetical protein
MSDTIFTTRGGIISTAFFFTCCFHLERANTWSYQKRFLWVVSELIIEERNNKHEINFRSDASKLPAGMLREDDPLQPKCKLTGTVAKGGSSRSPDGKTIVARQGDGSSRHTAT